ncbi:acid phosphatase [Maudiozyma humilis]|uniref:Acid phosphatase n=1 Tax=Maudiozyma humilis TaxID=51915 RepID=A0AAV5S6K7_MAUHU|nr:acid phosphatase [Kazachstania humilis]
MDTETSSLRDDMSSIYMEDGSFWERTHKPRLIILIRHGESESNKDKKINENVPNQLVALTDKGWQQAHNAGAELLKVLNVENRPLANQLGKKYALSDEQDCGKLPMVGYKPLNKSLDKNIVFYTSPYRRTRETLKGVLNVLDEYNLHNTNVATCPDYGYKPNGRQKSAVWPSPDHRPSGEYENDKSTHNVRNMAPGKTYLKYRVKDDPRIREQDFGNLQDVNNMQDTLKKRAAYGHFFFRFPQGESAADVYDRVASFQETMFRHFNERHSHKPRDVVVLVTHGIYARVFLMKWFRWTYEEFESFTNVPNGCMILMEYDEMLRKYVLRTQLPKWDMLEE